MTFRRAARVDANQKEIIATLRKAGCTVLIISQLKNCADIVVGYQGRNFIFELKTKTGKPTPGQIEFAKTWRGQSAIATSATEILIQIGAMKSDGQVTE